MDDQGESQEHGVDARRGVRLFAPDEKSAGVVRQQGSKPVWTMSNQSFYLLYTSAVQSRSLLPCTPCKPCTAVLAVCTACMKNTNEGSALLFAMHVVQKGRVSECIKIVEYYQQNFEELATLCRTLY